MAGLLEKLVCALVPDGKQPENTTELDVRLLQTPTIALERCEVVAAAMARNAVSSLQDALSVLQKYDPSLASTVREKEEQNDHYEDSLGTYLVQLSGRPISEKDSAEAAKLLRLIGDFERISDHAVHLVEAAKELYHKDLQFSPKAQKELSVLSAAVTEILELSLTSFLKGDLRAAEQVESLEQVISQRKEEVRVRHIQRLQQGECSIESGFIWSDLLTDLERTAAHCSNIAGCVIDMTRRSMNLHGSLRSFRQGNEMFREHCKRYSQKYAL
jgi:phosphate:Na+ symporter